VRKPITRPIVIAHRGASGYVPEHTLAAYAIAALQGADYIEPDLVTTRDGHLIACHDNLLNYSTDVAERVEFADRRTSKPVNDIPFTGWFSEDFSLDEIKRLRVLEPLPEIRPANRRFDGQFEVPTLQEIVDLVQALEPVLSREIGICPEIKHPTHFERLGLPLQAPLVSVLHENGYRGRDARAFIQSFEPGSLQSLRALTDLPLLQLLRPAGQPYDIQSAGGTLSFAEMATPAGLAQMARYADAVGPERRHFVLPTDTDGALDPSLATSLIEDAHAVGLAVYAYTFRAENAFLPTNLRRGDDLTGLGDVHAELLAFLATGIDGLFIDQPDAGVGARDDFLAANRG
jgi:glycerophosphoryl diester phosphodiesterase